MHDPPVPATGPALPPPEQRPPAGIFRHRDRLVGAVADLKAALDADLGRVVAVEEGGVDFHAADDAACDAEFDDDPVVGGGVVAAGFPAVEPGAGVNVVVLAANGGGGR